jgi:hypothetical protein
MKKLSRGTDHPAVCKRNAGGTEANIVRVILTLMMVLVLMAFQNLPHLHPHKHNPSIVNADAVKLGHPVVICNAAHQMLILDTATAYPSLRLVLHQRQPPATG